MAETGAGRRAEKRTGGAKRAASKGAAGKSAAAKPSRPRRSPKLRAVEEAVQGYFEALAARDAERMSSHWIAEGIEELVPLRVLRGQREIKGFFSELFAAVPDAEITVRRTVANDGGAAVEWRMSGTFRGAPFQGIEASGRSIELRGVDLLEIEDGKITRNTAYFDGAHFARQLGMLPPQDSAGERAMKGAFNAYVRLRKAVNERMGPR